MKVSLRIYGDVLGDSKERGKLEIAIAKVKLMGSYARSGLNVELDLASPYTDGRYFFFKTTVERCRRYDFHLEFSQKKIILENSVNCQTFEANINYQSDFDLMKQLSIEFLPISEGDHQISLKFSGVHLELWLVGNVYNVPDGKNLVWALDCDGAQFSANMSYSLKDRHKTIKMVYLWSTRTIQIISTLNTEDSTNPLFNLSFKGRVH